MNDHAEGEVRIRSESDIIVTRRTIRTVSTNFGFGLTDTTRIVTAASELARNIFHYAGAGQVRWRILSKADAVGIELAFEDNGPGIPDIDQAMQRGYTSSGGLGMGLPGAKRMMDQLEIQSTVGKGTTVTVRKWRKA